MAEPEHFPLYFPAEAPRPFTSEAHLRRVAKIAHLGSGSKLLELGGAASLFFAKELGCSLTVVDPSDEAVQLFKEQVKQAGLGKKVKVQKGSFDKLGFEEAEFDGILCLGNVPCSLEQATQSFRRLLAPRGRLVLTYPLRVGRAAISHIADFWKDRRLGEALRPPALALQCFEQAGYEPEGCESLSDLELDDLYHELERALPKATPDEMAQSALVREEIEKFRSQGNRSSVSFGLLVGRRKEPGEKPPPSRDGG